MRKVIIAYAPPINKNAKSQTKIFHFLISFPPSEPIGRMLTIAIVEDALKII